MEVRLYRNRDLLERHKICLRQGEIHIWQIQWEKLEPFWREYQFVMSSHEVEKAGNFHFFEDRMRYMAGKITVKLLLMQYLAEEKVVILNRRFGKPYHREVPGKQSVEFNLSHSGSMVLVAFGRGVDVGTDVQEIAECPDYMEIAKNFYTATESDDVMKDKGLETFFEYWSAKEAYLKAVGIGLGRGMDFFSVRGGVIKENGIEKQDWSLISVRIEGHAAFVAICEKGEGKNEI